MRASFKLLFLSIFICFTTQKAGASHCTITKVLPSKCSQLFSKDLACGTGFSSKAIKKGHWGKFSRTRKKRRAKGIEVEVPQIICSPVNITIHFKEVSITYDGGYFSSESYSCYLQRGPPLN